MSLSTSASPKTLVPMPVARLITRPDPVVGISPKRTMSNPRPPKKLSAPV